MQNLITDEMNKGVLPTSLTRKITIEGKTKIYPVYKVRLDLLYYNDQNDRIATWISQYKNENGYSAFSELSQEDYNSIIEKFIIQSNEGAIEKTQMNIALVNQREPGVILADGRIIDGNRRFTCLRRLAAENEDFNWFETVILDASIESSKKQIKMLELTIQHGEEKRVEYNPIDRLVGVYQDIVETGLLTVEEYAYSTNETVFEVKKRIEASMLLVEFLDYIHMPKQYHIAREYQVVSVISDLQQLLKKCSSEETKQKVKEAVFTNIFMGTIGDSRKYIRNLTSMMENGLFHAYIKDQERIGGQLKYELDENPIENKKELEQFVNSHEEESEELQLSLDKSLLKAKKHETRSKPSQIVSKSITLLKDVDTRVFEKLTDIEKGKLQEQLDKLSNVVDRFDTIIDPDAERTKNNDVLVDEKEEEDSKTIARPRYYIGKRHIDDPIVFCLNLGKEISSLVTTLEFEALDMNASKTEVAYNLFFIDENNNIISDVQEMNCLVGERSKVTFTLQSKASEYSKCFLAMQSKEDAEDELQELIPFLVKITFAADFDF